jgi:hypothetical protein
MEVIPECNQTGLAWQRRHGTASTWTTDRKWNSMTTATEAPEQTKAPEQEVGERDLHPLLLAALLRGREERGGSGIEHPLLLAALARD